MVTLAASDCQALDAPCLPDAWGCGWRVVVLVQGTGAFKTVTTLNDVNVMRNEGGMLCSGMCGGVVVWAGGCGLWDGAVRAAGLVLLACQAAGA